ncbi:MAG: hypothetical protein NPINA01_33180 [Nitrospinaceae bacterium]|nr:MAG: hypothetical protein NPINA01_33180 [Nitrospinaceae bacterium]
MLSPLQLSLREQLKALRQGIEYKHGAKLQRPPSQLFCDPIAWPITKQVYTGKALKKIHRMEIHPKDPPKEEFGKNGKLTNDLMGSGQIHPVESKKIIYPAIGGKL